MWINNEKKWNEVYVAKPYAYTSIIVSGGIPVWDKETQGWVDKAELEKKKKELEMKELQENLTSPSNDFSKFIDDEIKFGE
jgi:chitinase